MLVKILLTVMCIGLREQARDGGHPETSNTLRLRGHGEESPQIAGTIEQGPLGRHCSLRGRKLLTEMLCQTRGGLGRNTLAYFFCQCLPSAKPKPANLAKAAQERKSSVSNLL